MFNKHHIFTTPIVHEDFQGIRLTPNVYTTLGELDRFCEQMELIARKGYLRRQADAKFETRN